MTLGQITGGQLHCASLLKSLQLGLKGDGIRCSIAQQPASLRPAGTVQFPEIPGRKQAHSLSPSNGMPTCMRAVKCMKGKQDFHEYILVMINTFAFSCRL